MLRVLDHFGVAKGHLLGLSMGGRIAMRTALLHPDRVATLTLVDTHEGFAAFSAEQRQAFVDSRRAPLLAGKEPADIADPVARSLIGPHASPEHLEELRRSIAALHKGSYIKSLRGDGGAGRPRRHLRDPGAGALHRRRRRSAHAAGDASRDGRQARRRTGSLLPGPVT